MKIVLNVKPSDCDQFGHVNNAVYVSYIQHALAERLIDAGYDEDFAYNSPYFWDIRACSIEYRHAAIFGDTLEITLWSGEAEAQRSSFYCEITRTNARANVTGEVVARTKSVWERIERATGAAVALPEDLFAHFPHSGGEAPRAFALPEDDSSVRRYEWEHQVMRVELDPSGHIRPQAAYNWLEESVFDASAEGGWPPERRITAGFLIFQMRHDTQFFAFPEFGERVRIISRLVETRRFRGTWIQDIVSLNRNLPLIRDYSTGIFVDAAGRPVTPTPEMMNDLQRKDGIIP